MTEQSQELQHETLKDSLCSPEVPQSQFIEKARTELARLHGLPMDAEVFTDALNEQSVATKEATTVSVEQALADMQAFGNDLDGIREAIIKGGYSLAT